MKTRTLIRKAVKHAGSQGKLAKAMNVSRQRINQLLAQDRVSAETAIAIEEATGGIVTRNELRPDVFGKALAGRSTREAAE